MSDKVYDRAWKLLCDPSRWCQWEFAKDVYGRDVNVESPDAISWCAMGAIYKVYSENSHEKIQDLLAELGGISRGTIIRWNDASTHKEVFHTLQELDI